MPPDPLRFVAGIASHSYDIVLIRLPFPAPPPLLQNIFLRHWDVLYFKDADKRTKETSMVHTIYWHYILAQVTRVPQENTCICPSVGCA